jgi:hypothetical protein
MVMHGVRSLLSATSPEGTTLWWAGLARSGGVDESLRPCSLFRPTNPDQLFRAGGLIGRDGQVEVEGLDRMLRRLTLLIKARSYQPADTEEKSNLCIPSGYTYLLQFMAHDLVDSVLPPHAAQAVLRASVRNGRTRALVLDTLYGSGPDEYPHAYEYSGGPHQITINLPRTRLRVGARSPLGPDRTAFCPMRDIARSYAPKDMPGEHRLCEALVADARNDANTFVAQITVLFQLLHNHVLSLLNWPVPPKTDPAEDAFKRYLCARLIVTLIYRNIIDRDVLEKILDRRVLDRYRSENSRPLLDGGKGVPVEFSHGAFRFGHAMVRKMYHVASEKELEALKALQLASASRPGELPLPQEWLVDWARFFAIPAPPEMTRNFSHPIGPHYSLALRDDNFPEIQNRPGTAGLAYRDLLSGSYAGTLSVPALCQKLQSVFGANLVPSFEPWRPRLRQWLTAGTSTLEPDEIERLVEDPPLVFFVMLEAECQMQSGQCPSHASEPGQHLGPIGSIIVAETIFGAMSANPIVAENTGSLQARMIACAERLFPTNRDKAGAAVAEIDDVASMPDLLGYLQRKRRFAAPPPDHATD